MEKLNWRIKKENKQKMVEESREQGEKSGNMRGNTKGKTKNKSKAYSNSTATDIKKTTRKIKNGSATRGGKHGNKREEGGGRLG